MKYHDGTVVPALGQGSARLGQGRHPEPVEEEALREGISLARKRPAFSGAGAAGTSREGNLRSSRK